MFRLTVATAALLFCFSISADEVGEKVTLKYVAEPDITANIELFSDRIKIQDGVETVQMTMSGTLRTQTSAHPDGILAKADQYDINIETENKELKQFLDPLLETVSSVELNAVISDTGEITKLEGMKPILESTREAITNMAQGMPEEVKPMMDAMVKSIIETSLTEEAMLRQAREDWSLAVLQWVDAELEKGFIYEVEYAEPVLQFGGIELGFDGVYEYLGKVDCNEKDGGLRCVELSYQSTMKPEYAKQLTQAIAENLKLPLEDDFEMSIDFDALVVAEPLTLKTHRIDKIKSVKAPSEDGAGWIENVQRTSIVYSYQ